MKNGIFSDGNAMQLAGLAIMSGKSPGDAISDGLKQSAVMQEQQQKQAEYERQQRIQQMMPQLISQVDLTNPQKSFGTLAQQVGVAGASQIMKLALEAQQEKRLQQGVNMESQMYSDFMGNPSQGATGAQPANMQTGSMQPAAGTQSPTQQPSSGGGFDLTAMPDQQLMKGLAIPHLAPVIKAELDRRKEARDMTQKEQDRADKAKEKENDRVMPATALKDIADNHGTLAKIGDALNEVGTNKDAFGPSGYIAQNWANNIGADPKNVQARSVVGDIGSTIIKDRSGAAVTISEFPRLRPFVPQISDSPAVIKAKLLKLQKGINEENSATIKTYKDAGYSVRDLDKSINSASQAAAPQAADPRIAAAKQAGYSDAEIQQYLQSKGAR